MPKAEEVQVIVELTHHTLHTLRAVNGTIEAGGECVIENKAALEALIGAVTPGGSADGLEATCVWPDGVDWHLSNDTEALLDRTDEAQRAVAAAANSGSRHAYAFAACSAANGGPISPDGTEKWLLAHCTCESLGRVAGGIPGTKLEAAGEGPAAFARIAAVSRALRAARKGSVALWDLGTDRSRVLLVTANGVEGVAPCSVGLGAVFEAVQMALKLKFRGAGARLFFNEGYDFTEPGPKICAIVGADLKQALGLLPKTEDPPALACIGLTGRQAWFIRDIAAVAGTSPWAPDIKKLAGDLGLKFADDAVAASFSPSSAGLFELLASTRRAKDAWPPAWTEVDGPEEEEVVEAPAPEEEPEPEEQPAPSATRSKPFLASEGPAPPPMPLKSARVPSPKPPMPPLIEDGPAPARPAGPFPARTPAPAAAPAPSLAPPRFTPPPVPTPEPVSSAQTPIAPPAGGQGARSGPAAGAPLSKPVLTSLPFDTTKFRQRPPGGTNPGIPQPEGQEQRQPKSKVGRYVGNIATAALVFASIAVVLDSRMEKIKEHDLEQQEALAHHLAEVRLKEAEQIAKDSAAQSRKAVQSAIAATQKETEDATRRTVLAEVEEVRISKLPGTLVLATEPAGASVSIDGAAPLTSPVKLDGIAPGAHSLRITLAGHQSVALNADITGSKTTDLGTIKLGSSMGTLTLTSSPDDLAFAIREASKPDGKPVRSGRTPAKYADFPGGDYIATFTRPGCHDHVEKFTVEKGATVPVETRYQDGSLELSSDPSGAWVDKDGMRLGSTPLFLHDLTPKMASFELTLPGYDPTPISCEIPEGQTLKLTASLLRRDRVFNASEVKSLPVSYESPRPELSPSQRKMDAEVTLSFVVQRDGTVIDVKVEKTTDDDIGRRCATALAKWKFRPATAADDRTVDVKIEMPFKFQATDS